MSVKTDIRTYLEVIRRACNRIEECLGDLDEGDDIDGVLRDLMPKRAKPKRQIIQEVEEEVETPPPSPKIVAKPVQKVITPDPVVVEESIVRKEYMQEILDNALWPEAVPSNAQSSASVEDQINRANAVLDMTISRDTEGARFLDFGCGEGWMAKQMLDRGVASSTGFDLLPSPNWKKINGVGFTNVFKELRPSNYDIVMVYDVLDHSEDPMGLLKQVRSLVTDKGVVHIRCHPWPSRHASHLYKQGLNKAYIHLFLNWDEQVEAGYTPMYTRAEKKPLDAYRWWIHSAEFNVEKETIIKGAPVSDFFNDPKIKQMLTKEQQLEAADVASFYQDMAIDFVDYTLVPR